MDDLECRHGMGVGDCASCQPDRTRRDAPATDRTGHEKLLIHCPELCEESLLHFNRQGDSYRLRAFVGRRAGEIWFQRDAPTSGEFLRSYRPRTVVDVTAERIPLTRTERWGEIVSAHNRRAGIGAGR